MMETRHLLAFLDSFVVVIGDRAANLEQTQERLTFLAREVVDPAESAPGPPPRQAQPQTNLSPGASSAPGPPPRQAQPQTNPSPSASFASMTVRYAATDRLETEASTGPVAEGLDRLQYDLPEGPCLDERRAVDYLIRLSQNANVKLRVIAEGIVSEARKPARSGGAVEAG